MKLLKLRKQCGRFISLVMVGLSITVFLAPATVGALSEEQRRIFDSDIDFYDFEDAKLTCSVAGSGGSANTDIPPTFTLGTDAAQRRVSLIKSLMADYGLTAEQAAGPVGNFMYESSLVGGERLPPDVNQGESTGAPPKFSGGYGWAQWTGGRQRTFIDFAVEKGYMNSEKDRATDAANYAYLKKELNEGYKITITELKKQTTPTDAATSFEATFEKSGRPEITLSFRQAHAETAFADYSAGTPGSPVGDGTRTSSCGASGSAAIVGDAAFPLIISSQDKIPNRSIFKNDTTGTAGHPYTAYDILVDPGTPVAAFLSGTVTRITEDKCPGRMISIYNRDSDLTISYLHLSFANHVREGETIAVGQQIGLIGSGPEGCGTPHLHIDAAAGSSRPGCARENCPARNKAKFRDIGPSLYETFQAIPAKVTTASGRNEMELS